MQTLVILTKLREQDFERLQFSGCSCCCRQYAVPAPGFRDSGYNSKDGGLMYVGRHGEMWSSTVSGTYAFYLDYYTTVLAPSYPHGRALGFPVRCLQAFTCTLLLWIIALL